ncbi:chaperonin 10-like protein [Microdochium trichocladiopsis]|uniref:Chaperonin 10-like protein n=1 Tax=Microdochium trichocladiopsis TaxID=1682393 RepID=A0A9P9BSL1_9PEZI|nr:chaperonin 10-like protein [Microdochium trichocladiopsis]KAH7034562.1 chaperonin 10-like protein [Microdochium trichocladiopsis]
MATMKQWTTKQDGLNKMQFGNAPAPSADSLKDGEVLVKVNQVALNYRDTEVVMGDYKHHKSLQDDANLVPCSDICGTITHTTPGASGLQQGDRVMAIFNQSHLTGQIVEKDMASGLGKPLPGCLTEYRVFPASGLVKVPDYLSDAEAATLPIAAVTAWMAINSFQPIGQPLQGEDKYVLLQGTGGVSISGLQIAKALGLKSAYCCLHSLPSPFFAHSQEPFVANITQPPDLTTAIVTSSSDEKLARARALGADHTINYKTTPAWDDEVLRVTGNKGADVIFECGGAGTLARSFNCVAFGGLVSCIGYLSGKLDPAGGEPQLNTNVLALRRNVTLKGMLNGPKDRFEEMLGTYVDKQIRPVVDREFAFGEADQAFKYVQSGGHFGKVVVNVA